ncbi:FkbM family methyltransferase [Anabaena sp. 4-3]|uniref:FkbM family methyltransferase n=1 Tax=Anabaena sp. 4-3 TaxID=1811979 RepID=UPI00082CD183|nr:FkbM family methyltransferase [Anabaena sp. 4-3]
MKQVLKKIFRRLGLEVHRYRDKEFPPASPKRSIGNLESSLQDLRARGFVPQSILDVGANHAHWSRIAKSVFPKANCFLIEPLVEMKPYLESFCNDFPGSRWFMVGVGAKPEELKINIWGDNLDISSFLSEESENSGKQRSIKITTIDSLIEDGAIPIPQLVKLDIQGFELEALSGGSQLFGQTEVFILEVSLFKFLKDMPIFHEVISFMADKDYFVYDFPGFLRRSYDGALGQVDICFVKEGGLLRNSNRWD